MEILGIEFYVCVFGARQTLSIGVTVREWIDVNELSSWTRADTASSDSSGGASTAHVSMVSRSL